MVGLSVRWAILGAVLSSVALGFAVSALTAPMEIRDAGIPLTIVAILLSPVMLFVVSIPTTILVFSTVMTAILIDKRLSALARFSIAVLLHLSILVVASESTPLSSIYDILEIGPLRRFAMPILYVATLAAPMLLRSQRASIRGDFLSRE
jgi:hypothetical protein